MTAKEKSEGCKLLRQILKAKMLAWDLSLLAEQALGKDVDTEQDSVEDFLGAGVQDCEIDRLPDDDVLAIFNIR